MLCLGQEIMCPHNHDGQRLLAHELTHVAQQARQNPAITQDIKIAGDNVSEREANASASRISHGQSPVLLASQYSLGQSSAEAARHNRCGSDASLS